MFSCRKKNELNDYIIYDAALILVSLEHETNKNDNVSHETRKNLLAYLYVCLQIARSRKTIVPVVIMRICSIPTCLKLCNLTKLQRTYSIEHQI